MLQNLNQELFIYCKKGVVLYSLHLYEILKYLCPYLFCILFNQMSCCYAAHLFIHYLFISLLVQAFSLPAQQR